MQDAAENCQCPDLVGKPLKLELNFTYPLEHITELIVLEERMFSVAVNKFCICWNEYLKRIMLLSSK